VGRANHQQPAAAAPALRQQLFARVEAKALGPFFSRLPAVAAGPDGPQQQARTLAPPHQQGATFIRCRRQQRALQNDQAMPIELQARWRWCSHPDTLWRINNSRSL